MEIKNIHLMVMGGTIDSEWSPAKDTAVPLARSFIREYIQSYVKPYFEINETIVAMKDSREIGEKDCSELASAIKNSRSKNILVTHGTYLMQNSAKYINDFVAKNKIEKKIVFVGSFYPIVGYSLSDAQFNLGFAIASFSAIRCGVYVAMNGHIFKADNVEKNISESKFQEKIL